MARKKNNSKTKAVEVEEQDLGRFAGSSDEEEIGSQSESESELDDKEKGNPREEISPIEEKPGGGEDGDDQKGGDESSDEEDEDVSDPSKTVADSSAKMANVMLSILGSSQTPTPASSSIVLGRTVTPLQKLQKKEKDDKKLKREKRQANKERNLTSLHVPLSVATSNNVKGGSLSLSKELEQERLHRRVATRGVVALFNAISQHQKSSENEAPKRKSQETSKLTKHSFLEKIKDAAAKSVPEKLSQVDEAPTQKETSKWDALKEDYMLDPKKNWDQESSDDEIGFTDDPLAATGVVDETRTSPPKKRRVS